MTPKEKAQELIDKFSDIEIMFESQIGSIKYDELGNAAKQCSLIAVDEILNNSSIMLPGTRKYWQSVKTEIENL